MEKTSCKLSLDRPELYEIRAPGRLDESWADWYAGVTIEIVTDCTGYPVTILTGIFDQAALQGLLRRLYSLGVPLISAVLIEPQQSPGNDHDNESD